MTRREGVGHVPPLFSVIIPTYNRPDLLRCAVESVLTQTVQDLELTVVGDGSPTPVQIGDWAGARRSLLRSVRLRPSLRTPKQLVATFPRPFGRDCDQWCEWVAREVLHSPSILTTSSAPARRCRNVVAQMEC